MRAINILHTKEVKGDERILGYDNAEGKGDHRHYRDKEEPYKFSSIWDLLMDF